MMGSFYMRVVLLWDGLVSCQDLRAIGCFKEDRLEGEDGLCDG